MHVVVMVMGDLGRSPRMQYHAWSLLEAGHSVTLVGYTGEDLIPALQEYHQQEKENSLRVYRFSLPGLPRFFQKIALLYFTWRVMVMAFYTFVLLQYIRFKNRNTLQSQDNKKQKSIDVILVQNPPALPLLFVIHLFCHSFIFKAKSRRPAWIIDWHNLGYSMLRPNSSLQKIARKYEESMAPLAHGHLTVTKAMRDFVQEEFLSFKKPDEKHDGTNVQSTTTPLISVLYDCPPSSFQPLDIQQQHEILVKLDKQLCQACPRAWLVDKRTYFDTILTSRNDPVNDDSNESNINENNNDDDTNTVSITESQYSPRHDRPAMIVSSTSWTPDEDFGVLLEALVMLETKIDQEQSTLKVLVVVTGKGPQKDYYLQQISRLALSHVAVQTLWLTPQDYPKLLACADLGVSLHTSTSGLDLPMKVLDCFGCAVPVCALNFDCLPELVQDGVQGRVFSSSEELAEQLWDLLSPLATLTQTPACHNFGKLKEYTNSLRDRPRWAENWTKNALPLIEKVAQL